MAVKEPKINYLKRLKTSEKPNLSLETISYLNRPSKLNSKIYSKIQTNCIKCYGVGYLRISLDEAKTCLHCYGKGFLIKEVNQF